VSATSEDARVASSPATWVRYAGLAARAVLGGVFVLAGALKVTHPHEAGLAVQAYRLLPPVLARDVGYGLPVLEIALGVLLILGLFTRFAAILTGLLLIAFIIGVASVWARGLSIDCGCFGGGGEATAAGRAARYTREIARDVGLLVLAVFLAVRPRTALALDTWLTPPVLDDELGLDDDDSNDPALDELHTND